MKRGLQLIKDKTKQLLVQNKTKLKDNEIIINEDKDAKYFSNNPQSWILLNIYKNGPILPKELYNNYINDNIKFNLNHFPSYTNFRQKNWNVLKKQGKIEKLRYDMEKMKYPGYQVNIEKAFKNVI